MLLKHQITRIVMLLIYPIMRPLFIPFAKNYLTVFLFHEVTDNPSEFQLANSNYTTPKNFQRNISWIAKNYKVVSINEIGNLPTKREKPLAVITFDDAWKGQVEAVKHIQKKYNLPLTHFLNIGTIKSRVDIAALRSYKRIEVPVFKEDIELRTKEDSLFLDFLKWQGEIMTMDDVNEIDQLNLSTLANHSLHHYPATDLTDKGFSENVYFNENALKKFKSYENYFAFPFGRPKIDFEESHINLLKLRNYKYIFSADGKLNSLPITDQAVLSRVNFSPSDSLKSDFWWATYKNKLLRRA